MAQDYSAQKVAELQDQLKARNLPHTGKKADLIARLEASDTEKQSDPASASKTEATEESVAADTSEQTSKPVPEETQAQDESKTAQEDGVTAAAEADVPPQEDNAPVLPTVSLEEEIEKRRKRAERFGIGKTAASSTEGEASEEAGVKDDGSAAQKLLDRQKRFGGAGTDGNVAGLDALNQALPERQKKRGRQGGGEAERDGKRRDSRRREGRGKGEEKGETAPAVKKTNNEQKEKDRLAAEKRKARFATTTA